MTITGDTIATMIAVITLMAGGISVWVSLRERLAKAETEIETILMHLENQNELILQILQHLQDTENKTK